MRKRDLGILIICAFAILWSFRGEQGGYYFTEGWVIPIDTTLYTNLHFPAKGEKLPKPLITDLDGDGQNEIVYTSRDCTIKIAEMLPTMGVKAAPTPKAQSTLLRTTGVRTGRRPVGLASGYLQTGGGETKQVIVVVTEGWIVMCFDSNLDLLWENSPVDEVPEGYFHEEVAIIIAPHPVRIGDKGIVVVGGRLATVGLDGQNIDHEHDSDRHVGPDIKIEREEEGHHFSYYAFDGKSGALRWKHEEGDFFKDPHERDEREGEDDDVETFMPAHSFKQHVFSQSRHLGEVDWRQYREHVLAHLPYRWVDGFDSHFSLDRFEKKTNSGRKLSSSKSGDSTWNTEAIGIPNPLGNEDLATNQLTPKRDVEKPNVLVATVKGGLEVVHLFTGRPLCRLLLPPLEGSRSAGSYADVNGDGVIDSIVSSVDLSAIPSSSSNPSHVSVSTNCLGVVSSGVPPVEQLWNGSICKSSGLENIMFRGMGLTPKTLTTIAPSFIPSTVTLGLNTIFMVSSGRISAYGPNGESLWQVGSTANWRSIDYPVLTPIHILPGDPTLHLIAIGTSLSLISPDGELLSNIRLRKTSDLQEANTVGSTIAGGPKHGEIWSVAPPTLGDIDNDGLADVIIVGHDGLYAFTVRRGMGSWLFASLVITLICVMLFALVQSEGGGIVAKVVVWDKEALLLG